ncbi:MAG: transporter [Gemmatimonadaceae bacterium]|jgi:hypothetical protein|nr:transporter [Gemmatimonadaceae bacterium]
MTPCRRWLGAALCLAYATLASPLYAQQCPTSPSIAADRPGNLTGPSVVTRGHLQFESGANHVRGDGASVSAIGATLLRVGLGCRVEARASSGGWMAATTDGQRIQGLADGWAGMKALLLAGGGHIPQLAVITGALLPTRSVHSRHHVEPDVTVSAAWALPHGHALLANVGAARRWDADTRVTERLTGASWSFPVHGVGSFVEYSEYVRATSALRILGTGVTLLPRAAMQLDASVLVPLNTARHDPTVGIGLSRRW